MLGNTQLILQKWQKYLIKPLAPVDAEQEATLRYVAGTLLAFCILAAVLLAFFTFIQHPVGFYQPNTIIGWGLCFVAYLLARYNRLTLAAWTVVIAVSVSLFISVTPPNINAPSPILLYFVVPMAFGVLFLSLWAQILINFSIVLTVALLPVMFPAQMTYDEMLITVITLLIVFSMLGLCAGTLRWWDREVSQRRITELRTINAAFRHREKALYQHALQQAIVSALGQRALYDSRTQDDLLTDAAMLMYHGLTDVNTIRIYEVFHTDAAPHFNHCASWPQAEASAPTAAPPTILMMDVMRRGETVIIEDMTTDPRYHTSDVYQAGMRGGLCVALHTHTRIIGLLEVYSQQKAPFKMDDINFLQSVANVLAAYIERHHADLARRQQLAIIDAQREIVAALNSSLGLDDVLDTMLNNLPRLVPHDSASIMLVTNHIAQIIRHRGFDPAMHDELIQFGLDVRTDKFMRHMIESHTGVIVPDVYQDEEWTKFEHTISIRGYMGVPILHQGEFIGVINVDSHQPNTFKEEHLQRLQSFADQASIAIRNANRTAELEHRVAKRTTELDRERRFLQGILDGTGEGILYAEEAHIRFANATLSAMTGYAPYQLINTTIDTLFPIQSRHQWDWHEVRDRLTQVGVWRGEATIQRNDGTTFEAGITMSAIDSDHMQTVTIVRDISTEKELEAQKTRFIANASHELRSPLTSLNMRIFMMQRDPARLLEHFDSFSQSVDRLNRLVEDLLDVSRFENGIIQLRRRNIVLQRMAIDAVQMHQPEAQDRQIQLYAEVNDTPLTVYADPDRIGQVLSNLITNAINYTAEGGVITVKMYNNGAVYLEVCDTGYGISPADLDKIFTPFFRATTTSHIRGTGLGLSISREIMRLHGGELTVESEVGKGSVFRLMLPPADV